MPECVVGALEADSPLVSFFKAGPRAFLERLVRGGRGDLEIESFSAGRTTFESALDDPDDDFTPVSPKIDGELYAVLDDAGKYGRGAKRSGKRKDKDAGVSASASDGGRGGPKADATGPSTPGGATGGATTKGPSTATPSSSTSPSAPPRYPCVTGLPRFARELYDAYVDGDQFLVLQPGASGDLRPHVDYLATAVLYVVLHGAKTVTVWRPFGLDDVSNLERLADGFVADVDVEASLVGPKWVLHAQAGDALFIPPLFPHVVHNTDGGSVAWGQTPRAANVRAARERLASSSESLEVPLVRRGGAPDLERRSLDSGVPPGGAVIISLSLSLFDGLALSLSLGGFSIANRSRSSSEHQGSSQASTLLRPRARP